MPVESAALRKGAVEAASRIEMGNAVEAEIEDRIVSVSVSVSVSVVVSESEVTVDGGARRGDGRSEAFPLDGRKTAAVAKVGRIGRNAGGRMV